MEQAMDDIRTGLDAGTVTAKMSARGVQVHYGTNHALKDVDVDILDRAVTAYIGPTGYGKSTYLR
jgi:phosphate transport system ATP-binding protein